MITDIGNWADVSVLINADENTVAWYAFKNQQFLQYHVASYTSNNIPHAQPTLRSQKTCNQLETNKLTVTSKLSL